MAAPSDPFVPLLLAVAAPLLWGWRWRRPTWQMLVLGVGFYMHVLYYLLKSFKR